MKKIIALAGSNSSNSINHQLIQAVANQVKDVNVEIISLRDYPSEIYGIDSEKEKGFPPSMMELNEKFAEADGFIVSTPEHNGSIPAVLKNTIDWLSRISRKVFNDKPLMLLSTSPGARGGKSALKHLMSILPYQGANVIGGQSIGSFHEHVKNGVVSDPTHQQAIKQLTTQLLKAV